jgi:hypothetical protein
MHRIKKLYVASLLAGVMMSAYTQPSLIIGAGVTRQNLTGENAEGTRLSNDVKTSFRVGAYVELNLQQAFFLQPGLFFSTKGAENVNEINDQSTQIYYLEIPVNLVYKSSLGSGSLLIGLGAYFAYALGGNRQFAGGTEEIVFTNNIESPVGVPYMKPFDAGMDMMLGYEFPFRLRVLFNIQLGMLNLEPKIQNSKPKAITKNSGYVISLGYRF